MFSLYYCKFFDIVAFTNYLKIKHFERKTIEGS